MFPLCNALGIAKYIINKCIDDDCPINNLQLQKILFYIQYDNLKKRDEVLFKDNFFAWKFGPVIPNVYYYFSGYGVMKIIFDEHDVITPSNHDLFDSIIEELRGLPPWELAIKTHKKNGSWDRIFDNGKGYNTIIPIADIKKYG